MTVDVNFYGECPVCNGHFSQNLPYLNKAYQRIPELQSLEIVVCDDCGLGIAYPEKSWTAMQRYYKSLYRASCSVHRNVTRPLFSEYSVSSHALSQWLLLRTFRSFDSDDSFCDIGPGGGATFQTARFLGLNMRMFAYEPDEFSIPYLHRLGVEVYELSFNPQIELPPVKLSAIIMSHVLEHFSATDSIAVLKTVRGILLDDGVFLCEVPNTPMLTFGKQRIDDTPHLTFWSIEALKRALVLAGLRPLYISTAGEKYKDWWDRAKLSTFSKNTGFRNILKKSLLKYNSQIFLRSIDRIRYILQGKTPYNHLYSADFDYGKDRVYIRAICVVDS